MMEDGASRVIVMEKGVAENQSSRFPVIAAAIYEAAFFVFFYTALLDLNSIPHSPFFLKNDE